MFNDGLTTGFDTMMIMKSKYINLLIKEEIKDLNVKSLLMMVKVVLTLIDLDGRIYYNKLKKEKLKLLSQKIYQD